MTNEKRRHLTPPTPANWRARTVVDGGVSRDMAIITADAVREMRLEKGQIAAALVKSTDVMVMRAK